MTDTTTQTRSLADVLDGFRFAHLVTSDGGALTSRPLTVQEVDDDVLRFLVDVEADWSSEADGKPVLLAFADPSDNAFVSVTGAARLSQDRATIERLYDPEASAFFDSADDPRLRVLEVTATSGEWWDGPSGRVGQAVAMLRAKVTHDEGAVGESGSIDLR